MQTTVSSLSSLSVDFTKLIQLVTALIPKQLELRITCPSSSDPNVAYGCVIYESDICDFTYNIKEGVATAKDGFFRLVFEECQRFLNESSSSIEWDSVVEHMAGLINDGEDNGD